MHACIMSIYAILSNAINFLSLKKMQNVAINAPVPLSVINIVQRNELVSLRPRTPNNICHCLTM